MACALLGAPHVKRQQALGDVKSAGRRLQAAANKPYGTEQQGGKIMALGLTITDSIVSFGG